MDIQVGDRVTYENLEGNIVSTLIYNNVDTKTIKEVIGKRRLLKIERPKYELIEEKKELLTEEEKEFLRSYIKLLNIKNIEYIEEELNELYIHTKDTFYRFDIDSTFLKMEISKHYTLEELLNS